MKKNGIKISKLIKFICLKLKVEVECGVQFSRDLLVPGFLFSVLGDNKEIYDILNLSISFGTSRFPCRICDIDTKKQKKIKLKV